MKKILFLFYLSVNSCLTYAQVGIGTTTPNNSAKLDIVSTTQGVLFPRMSTTQRMAIIDPATGLFVFQTDGTIGLYYFDGANWRNLTTGYIPNNQGFANQLQGVGVVTVYAGNGTTGNVDGPLLSASFRDPNGIAGSLITDYNGIRYMITPNVTNTIGVADITDITVCPSGTYLSFSNGTIRRFMKFISTSSLDFTAGAIGEFAYIDGPGLSARLMRPRAITSDASSNLYVADQNKIRKITTPGVFVSTINCVDANNNPVEFGELSGIAVNSAGIIYVSDRTNNKVYKVSGNIGTVFAGSGSAIVPDLYQPTRVVVDPTGNLYVSQATLIWKITPSGEASILVGGPHAPQTGQFANISAMHIPASGTVMFVADADKEQIYKINLQ